MSLSSRRARKADETAIRALIGSNNASLQCVKQFGRYSIAHIIETSVLSVCVVNESDQVVGFASFLDAPPSGLQLGVLSQDKWPTWFSDTFNASNYRVDNTVWLTFFIAHEDHKNDVADRILQTVFSTLPDLEAVLALLPLEVATFTPVKEMFEQLPLNNGPEYFGPKAFACPRNFFIPPLRIRRARIEDHDDLVPIFNQQSEVLTAIYGEFFLAELIESRAANNHSLVAEVNGHAVGLMNLTKDMDVRLLQKCFDLSPWDNLKKKAGAPSSPRSSAADVKRAAADAAAAHAAKAGSNEPSSTLPVQERLVKIFDALVDEEARDHGGEQQDDEEGFVHKQSVYKLLDDFIQTLEEHEEIMEAGTSLDLFGEVEDDALDSQQFVDQIVAFARRLHGKKVEQVVRFMEQRVAAALKSQTSILSAGALAAPPAGDDGKRSKPTSRRNSRAAGADGTQTPPRRGSRASAAANAAAAASAAAASSSSSSATASSSQAADPNAVPGADNVFCVTLFCLDEGFEARAVDFLAPAFDLYPTREYCLLTLPHTAEESQLLRHFTFVKPLPSNTFNHVLYLLHRDSVGARVAVRWAGAPDTQAIAALLGHLPAPQSQAILAQLERSVGDKAAAEREQGDADKKRALDAKQSELKTAAGAKPAEPHAFDLASIDDDERSWVDRVANAAMVVTCEDQVVGVVLTEAQYGTEQLRADYSVEDYVNFADIYPAHASSKQLAIPNANLRYFVLNPLFARRAPFIFREVLRLFRKTVLYYRVYPNETLQDVLDLFVQVRPRRKPVQPKELVTIDALEEEAKIKIGKGHAAQLPKHDPTDRERRPWESSDHDHKSLFALHLLTRGLISQPKLQINARIVVVGSSNTALSFIESLILVPELNYSNISLLSKKGLYRDAHPESRTAPAPDAKQSAEIKEKAKADSELLSPKGHEPASSSLRPSFLPWRSHYDVSRIRRLAVESRIRIVAQSLADFDCEQKIVRLGNGDLLPYDYLILLPGLQDQTASGVSLTDENVQGIFPMTNHESVDSFLQFHTSSKPTQFIVYGATLNAVTTIRGLLDLGAVPSNIVWIHRFSANAAAWCDHDKIIHEKITKSISRLGVRSLPNYKIAGVKHNQGALTYVVARSVKPNRIVDEGITAASLLAGISSDHTSGSEDKSTLLLPCQALLGCDTPDVDPAVFKALMKNSLVYDGRMVVDANFATSDPHVFAAGPFAKFSRKYGRQLNMEDCDSVELGKRLAEAMLRVLDPASAPAEDSKATLPPPQLGVVPRVHEALLPGGFHYLFATKPSIHEVKKPKVLVTNANERLCRMVFDDADVLRSICYLGKSYPDTTNLIQLVGVPASYMNRILFRYSQDEIPDLISFLQGSWAAALYHESFYEMRQRVLAALGERKEELHDLLHHIVRARSDDEKPDPSLISKLAAKLPTDAREFVQLQLLRFLYQHANHLPGYVIPPVAANTPVLSR